MAGSPPLVVEMSMEGPMASDFLTVMQAVAKAKERGVPISDDTVRYWASRKGLGLKIFGIWQIDSAKFERVLSGNPVEHIDAV